MTMTGKMRYNAPPLYPDPSSVVYLEAHGDASIPHLHVFSVHEGKKQFKCEICDYSSSRKGNLKLHVASVHEKNIPFKCEMCDYSCSLKSSLQIHVASVHEAKKHSNVPFVTKAFLKKVP